MEKDIFNEAYFREGEKKKGKTKAHGLGMFTSQGLPLFPLSFSSPASPVFSVYDSSQVTERIQAFPPLCSCGACGTELSFPSSVLLSAPQLKQI